MLSLIYRIGTENGKAKSNPAKLLRRKREDNGRVRFLNQYTPAKTEVDFLKNCRDEELRLRAVIGKECAAHLPEFEIAPNTGMRPSEQYGLTWDRVDLERRFITISKSKNGKTWHIGLSSVALAAFAVLRSRPGTQSSMDTAEPVFVNMQGERLQGYKHWFDDAVREAGIRDFTWYCLRYTFARRLAMAGASLRDIAEAMGHKTIQMTMRYAHLAPAHQLSVVDLLVPPPAEPQAEEHMADGTREKPGATTSATSAAETASVVSFMSI